MHSLAPKGLPALSTLLEAIGSPSPIEISKHLDVNKRTVQRWILQDFAPRAVELALFFETWYGRHAVNCAAINDARHFKGQLDGLNREIERLNALVMYLEVTGHFGSANQPTVQPVGQKRREA